MSPHAPSRPTSARGIPHGGMLRAAVFALALMAAVTPRALAQNGHLMIDPVPGIDQRPNLGTGMVSPYISDWFREGSISLAVIQNPMYPGAKGVLNMVFLARLEGPGGTLIAQSNTAIATRYQTRNFRVGTERFVFSGSELNFMAEGPSEGALVFTPPYNANTRLPGGSYRLAVSVWEFVAGRGLVSQLADEEFETVVLPAEDQDLRITVRVNETSPYFSDWQANANAAEVEIENVWRRAMSVYMEARIDDERGPAISTRSEASRALPPITLTASPGTTLSARQIPFFNPTLDPTVRSGLFDFRTDIEAYRRAGRFPEGVSYRLCVQLRDQASNAIRGVYECSDPFTIDFPPPPELDQPEDRSVTTLLPTFMWSHDLRPTLVPSVRYRLQIKRVPASGDVTPDIFTRMDPATDIEVASIIGLSHPMTVRDPRLIEGQRYAWRVQASTPAVTPPVRFQQEGWSAVHTFHYAADGVANAPELLEPGDASSVTLPRAFSWTPTTLPGGRTARYILRMKEVRAGATIPANFFDTARAQMTATLTATELQLPDARFALVLGRRYAWRVDASDPAGVPPAVITNGGKSETWTFTFDDLESGGDDGEEADPRIMLAYPGNGEYIPDRQPPFVAIFTLATTPRYNIRLRIEELERAGGGAGRGEVFTQTVTATLPSSGSTLLLNPFGTGGTPPAGQPLFGTARWTPEQGGRYRWTVEATAEGSTAAAIRSSAVFMAWPRASNLSPRDGRTVDARTEDLYYVVSRPIIERDASTGAVITGFRPGDLPTEASARWVMNPVIRNENRLDTVIRYQMHVPVAFTGTNPVSDYRSDLPLLADGRYRMVVQTKVDGRVVGTSEEALFIVGSTNPCTSPCICLDGIYPVVDTTGPEVLIPYRTDARFSIGFRPTINASAVSGGTVRVWVRRGLEGDAVTGARPPEFTGTFTTMTPRGSSAELSIFDIDPRDSGGQRLPLTRATHYMWEAEVTIDPARIRADATTCAASVTRASTGHLFFSTMDTVRGAPECNPMVTNVTAPTGTTLPASIRLGGYTLQPDAATCRADNGRILPASGQTVGTGRISSPLGTWAVQFTELSINTDNEVITGSAIARTRDDIPSAIRTALSSASLTADQVRSLNQLWHGGGSLLEIVTGDKRVPFGLNMDMDFLGGSSPGPWAFKLVVTKMTFEPTRAYYDLVCGVRVPMETREGESTQWVGLYGQDLPFCTGTGTRWRAALRYLDNTNIGSPAMDGWEFVIKKSEREDMPVDYTLQPGDGTALVFSERGFEQLHIEVGLRIPRNVLVPQRENASHQWVDVPEGGSDRVEATGVFDFMREGRTLPDDESGRPRSPLGGGFYLVADLPRCRIANSNFTLAARDVTIDLSTSWSPTASAAGSYTIPGMGTTAIPTRGAAFTRPASWTGLFIREATLGIPGLNTPIGVLNMYSSSPMSFTAFAAPMAEARIGDDFTVRLDTIDFMIDRGNFVRARVMSSMTFPGAMEGRVGLDLAYQQLPETPDRATTHAFVISLNAREDEVFRITDFIAFTIRRGSQMNVSYSDPPARPGGSNWGFAFDISGGIKFTRRNERGDDVISLGGIDFENFRFATDGRGLQAPRITIMGVPVPTDSSGMGGGGSGGSGGGSGSGGSGGSSGGSSATAGSQRAAGFPIGLRSLGITFSGEGMSMGLSAVVTIALTGEPSSSGGGGPTFGGAVGLELNGALAMRDGRLQWGAPTLRLTSVEIDFRSEALSIIGRVEIYENDPTWGNGFSGDLTVSMAKMFTATASLRLGARPTFRYWFIRGELTTATPIVAIGPVGVYGFLGGAYQHMDATVVRNAGGAVTDVRYVPTEAETFGIMAGVHIGLVAKPSTFHAKIVLTARFRDANLTNISLDGKGWFMCELDQECNGPDDSWVNVHLGFDFPESRFHATLAGNINLTPLLRISAPEGAVDILFEPGNWHVYIGRGPFSDPDRRTIMAEFFPRLVTLRAECYMMAGNSINVNIGGVPLRGGGFATGVKVDFRAGGKFLIFYGEVWGNLLAELAVINVDETTSMCIAGANGWYALANFSLGLGVAVGIDVDLWIASGRYEIFRAELGVNLLLGGPDPTFLDGDARGSYSILGGAISGQFHYHLHVGDDVPTECITAAMDGQYRMPEPITSVAPRENETNVSVFTTVGLGFALPEKGEIELRRGGRPIRARFRLATPLDIRPAAGSITPGAVAISPDRLSAEWSTEEVLLENTRYTVSAIAIAEEWNGSAWVETKRQVKTWSFTTGQRPRDVYDPNVAGLSYPLRLQRFSYVQGHGGRHYLHLKRNMDYLFTNMARGQTLLAEYTDEHGARVEVPMRYEPYRSGCGAMLVVENLDLDAATRYHLRLIKRTTPDARFSGALGPWDPRLAGYKTITAEQTLRARELVVRAGGESRALQTGAGSFLVQRREGMANSRVVQRGSSIDTLVFDWFFRTGAHATPEEKFRTVTSEYQGRLGSFLAVRLRMEEPIDDDLTGVYFSRKPEPRNKVTQSWMNFLVENDRLSRDYALLVSRVGATDAALLRPFVLTTSSRLLNRNQMYVHAAATETFSPTAAERWVLKPHELRFEERSINPKAGLGLRIPAAAFGPSGGMMASPGQLAQSGVTIDAPILPMNAVNDLSSLRWRYENALTRTVTVAGFIPVPIITRLAARTIDEVRRTAARTWRQLPAATYQLGLVHKTMSWRVQSVFETTYSTTYARQADIGRLEGFSLGGTARTLSFGEISCGEPGAVPLVTLPLVVP